MLEFKLENDILEVKESILGWNDTKVSYVYYDVKNWLKSFTGKKDEKPTRQCNDSDIQWVTKYYLPKIKILKYSNNP